MGKIIQVPLDEYDASLVQVALGAGNIQDFVKKDPDSGRVAEALDRLNAALVKAINDSW